MIQASQHTEPTGISRYSKPACFRRLHHAVAQFRRARDLRLRQAIGRGVAMRRQIPAKFQRTHGRFSPLGACRLIVASSLPSASPAAIGSHHGPSAIFDFNRASGEIERWACPGSLLLNVLWIVFGGAWMAFGWLVAAVIMAITIIGLPWARAAFNIAVYTLFPFGSAAVSRDEYTGAADIGTGPLGRDRQHHLVRAGGLVAGARPSRHRRRSRHHHRRHSLRLGAPQACRHRAVADRQGHRSRVTLYSVFERSECRLASRKRVKKKRVEPGSYSIRTDKAVAHGRRLRRRLQPLELIVANLGLADQHAAAKALHEIAADGTEPPRQRALRPMTDHDEMRADFFGDFDNFLSGVSDLQPRGRGKAERLQPIRAFGQNGLVILGLQLDRYVSPASAS